MSILKQKLSKKTIDELYARKTAYKNRVNGGNLEASVTNPAYCIVKPKNGPVIPESHNKEFSDVYSGGNMRHRPILKSVTVTHGGNFGMVITADVEIECYTLSDFNSLEEHFCRPGKLVDISFGYARPYNANAYSSNGKFSDMMISSYEFNTGDETTWSIKFKATSGVEAVKSLDMVTSLSHSTDHGKFKIGNQFYPVQSLIDLMIFHTQESGTKNLSKFTNGEVIEIPNLGHCVLYKVDEALEGKLNGFQSFGRMIGNFFGHATSVSDATQEKRDSKFLEYFTLEYVVNLFNNYIHTQYNEQVQRGCSPPETKKIFQELKVDFDQNESISYIPKHILSADPFNVLLLGGSLGRWYRGDYANPNSGIKFYNDLQDKSIMTYIGDDISGQYHKMDIKNILVSLDLICSALNTTRPTRENNIKDDISEEEDSLIKVHDFFNSIFQSISNATAGAIRLRLAAHPMANESDIYKNKLYVIDEANAVGTVDVVIFDTINGDGVTKTASITSGVGSQTYQSAMFQGTNKGRDSAAIGCLDNDLRNYEIAMRFDYDRTVHEISKLINGRDSLIVNGGFKTNDLSTLVAELRKIRNLHERGRSNDPTQLVYPGLGCNVELEGIYGFIPGNGMMLNLVPNKQYIDSGRYFYIDSVTHTFQGDSSEWVTKLDGKLNMTSRDQIESIDLRGV